VAGKVTAVTNGDQLVKRVAGTYFPQVATAITG
jgi:hypothetical protein